MDIYKKIFNGAGWFIPPYVSIGSLSIIAKEIVDNKDFCLEELLSYIYTEKQMSAMILHRYPFVPHVKDYSEIIKESVEAHFLGLDHLAVSGLIPVVEGVGRKVLKDTHVAEAHVRKVFTSLSNYYKEDVVANNLGTVEEIVPMLDSFAYFASENLYINSDKYPHSDKTNRHGILHGAFSDIDYGSPLNFYKIIGAIDFLSFVVSIRGSISFFAPGESSSSVEMAMYFKMLGKLKVSRKGL